MSGLLKVALGAVLAGSCFAQVTLPASQPATAVTCGQTITTDTKPGDRRNVFQF